MSAKRRPQAVVEEITQVELNHLRRETRTALELALCAGLLEAFAELPAEAPPLNVHVPKVVIRSRTALHEWTQWQSAHGGPHD